MATRVYYQCTGRTCGLETPYKPGKSEKWCGACGARLRPCIERGDEDLKSLLWASVWPISGAPVSDDPLPRGVTMCGIAVPREGSPGVASLVSAAREIDKMRRAH